jgi:hypothetical protein
LNRSGGKKRALRSSVAACKLRDALSLHYLLLKIQRVVTPTMIELRVSMTTLMGMTMGVSMTNTNTNKRNIRAKAQSLIRD